MTQRRAGLQPDAPRLPPISHVLAVLAGTAEFAQPIGKANIERPVTVASAEVLSAVTGREVEDVPDLVVWIAEQGTADGNDGDTIFRRARLFRLCRSTEGSGPVP